MSPVVDNVPGRVLAIYAHPDDADVSCGGALARWVSAGAEAFVVVCTRGDKGSLDPAVDPVALAQARATEVAAAASALGLTGHHLLSHSDGELANDVAFRGELVALIRDIRPDVVVCPDPTAVFYGDAYVNHHDHRVVGYAAIDAVAPAAWSPHYFPNAGPPHRVAEIWLSGSLEPEAWVDITAVIDKKAEALACHRSQLGEAGEWLRTIVHQRAEEAGGRAGVRYAEGFRRIVLAG